MSTWTSSSLVHVLGKIGATQEQSDISPRIHNSQVVKTAARGERLQSLLLQHCCHKTTMLILAPEVRPKIPAHRDRKESRRADSNR